MNINLNIDSGGQPKKVIALLELYSLGIMDDTEFINVPSISQEIITISYFRHQAVLTKRSNCV